MSFPKKRRAFKKQSQTKKGRAQGPAKISISNLGRRGMLNAEDAR
jgi:hypothetical protein